MSIRCEIEKVTKRLFNRIYWSKTVPMVVESDIVNIIIIIKTLPIHDFWICDDFIKRDVVDWHW